MPSPLVTQLATLATDAETVNGETFTYGGASYVGVLSMATVNLALAVPGYPEAAEATLQASRSQWSTVPTSAVAVTREIITMRSQRWKITAFEDDGLHLKFRLRLEQ